MSDVFTASNGTKIETSEKDGGLEVTSSWDFDYLFEKHVDALREWFQAERDAELGRDRDAESPDWVVYPLSGCEGVRELRVMNERHGRSFIISEDGPLTGAVFAEAACRWFAAHPPHRAWHDAEPGEAWVITVGGTEMPALVARKTHEDPLVFKTGFFEHDLASPGITAGRRIWAPEEADDE